MGGTASIHRVSRLDGGDWEKEFLKLHFRENDLNLLFDIFMKIAGHSEVISVESVMKYFNIHHNDCIKRMFSKICDVDEVDDFIRTREFVFIIWHIQTISFNLSML
jgi:hypothetical protein